MEKALVSLWSFKSNVNSQRVFIPYCSCWAKAAPLPYDRFCDFRPLEVHISQIVYLFLNLNSFPFFFFLLYKISQTKYIKLAGAYTDMSNVMLHLCSCSSIWVNEALSSVIFVDLSAVEISLFIMINKTVLHDPR